MNLRTALLFHCIFFATAAALLRLTRAFYASIKFEADASALRLNITKGQLL
jgi:hypothetical protein